MGVTTHYEPPPGSDPAEVHIDLTQNESGWVTAQIREFPAAISQGPTEHEAWLNVLDAFHDLTHEPTLAERVAFTAQARLDRLAELIDQVRPVVIEALERGMIERAIRDGLERHRRTRV